MEKRGEEGGGIKFFPQNFLVSVPKKFVRKPFSVLLISGIEKFYAREGYIKIFFEIFLSSITKKLRRGTILCFTNFLVSMNFMEKRGEREGGGSIKIFRRTFFVTDVENFRRIIL